MGKRAMAGLVRNCLLATLACACLAATPARAVQVCGWLTETTGKENLHEFELWLQSDGEAEGLYKMTGEGIVTENMRNYSPGSGTFFLHAGRPAKMWGFGSTLYPPGDIDIVAEVHAKPASIFDEVQTPPLGTFTFRRHVPEDETAPPKAFAAKQCATLPSPRH
jgi:hypothetical protein